MKKLSGFLMHVPLFAHIADPEIDVLLSCLGGHVRAVEKGEVVLRAGDPVTQVGVVLEGMLQIAREDAEGGRVLLMVIGPNDFFGEALSCAGVKRSPVTVSAESASTVLLVDFKKILGTCSRSCTYHTQLIENMMGILAKKNLFLQERMEVLSKKTIREKLLRYLEGMAPRAGVPVTIPLNRNALADYLGVDRSALSRELGRLRDEGVLQFRKNIFTLREKSYDI